MADFGGILATLRKEEKQLAAVPYGAKKRPRVANRRGRARAGLWSAQMMCATSSDKYGLLGF